VNITDEIEVVLVATDGSFFARRGILAASALVPQFGAGIRLFSAVPKDDDVEEREQLLSTLGFPATVVVDLDPAGALHEEVRRLGKAVACMASHGHGRSAAFVGSVATDIVVRGHDPVILAGPMVEEAPQGRGVVVSVDDDPATAHVLPIARQWARRLHEPLIIVSVAEPAPPSVRGGVVRRAFGPDGDVQAFLDGLVAAANIDDVEIETVPIYDPISPAVGLEAWMRVHPAPLVVTGSHARTGLERLALGSVSAGIVRHCPAPVLVIPLAHLGGDTP
jgi:nucleotide-binding universal stress UspA family protein